MYGQLLYFIVAILLFTLQPPTVEAPLPPLETALLGLGLFALFAAVCRTVFGHLTRSLIQGAPQAVLTLRYFRAQTMLSILALMNLGLFVYGLHVKHYLQGIPGLDASSTLSGIIGLGIFLLHLETVWYFAHPVYRAVYRSEISRVRFMKGHFAFSSAILIPWLLISFFSDVLDLLDIGFLRTELGEFATLGVLLVVFLCAAPVLVVRLWGCKSLPDSPVLRELEQFCASQGFRVGGFLLWPLLSGEMLTAGIIGILPRWRYILITRGLLNILDMEELKAVVAHEMGHVRRFHLILFLTFFLCFFGLIVAFGGLLEQAVLWLLLSNDGLFFWVLTRDSLTIVASGFPILALLILYFRFIFGFFLRNSERQADLYAMQLVGHPYTLVSSFQKIALYSGQSEDIPSWHHYSIRQRMDFLLDAYRNQDLVRRHHRKLYAATLVFFVAVGSLIGLRGSLNAAGVLKEWRSGMAVTLCDTVLQRKPHHAGVYLGCGGLALDMGQGEKAEALLREGLRRFPEDPLLLNALAWLYATSPPPRADAGRALELARQAASINPLPEILDTLAEAYYANGRYAEALEAIERAISKEPQRDYFLKQKEKFEKALEEGRKAG